MQGLGLTGAPVKCWIVIKKRYHIEIHIDRDLRACKMSDYYEEIEQGEDY